MSEAETVKFVLRISPALHKKVKRSAKRNNTSMNKEVTNILNERFSSASDRELLAEIGRDVKKLRYSR